MASPNSVPPCVTMTRRARHSSASARGDPCPASPRPSSRVAAAAHRSAPGRARPGLRRQVGKRTGFLIMLTLAGMIAIAGVLTDSTATVIGAMIIAPLGTPILGIALGIVTGHLSLVVRSILWVLAGLVIVVVLGLVFSIFVATPESLATNSQVVGRTSPSLMDLIAALATGFAGGFAMCRKDLSAVLPGVAIAISLVPPLGVVGRHGGSGPVERRVRSAHALPLQCRRTRDRGQHRLHVGGYARDPGSRRRRTAVVHTSWSPSRRDRAVPAGGQLDRHDRARAVVGRDPERRDRLAAG